MADAWPRLIHTYRTEIWQSAHLKDRSPRGFLFASLRVISITITVFGESRVASRAAALSFSTLLGLGPLIAIAVLVAGFALGKNDPGLVADTLNRMVKVVAPQVAQYEQLTADPAAVNPQLVDIINNIVTASRSVAAGTLGGISLILIVLLLFKNIEDAFNDIWGVHEGRSVLMRIVFYWTILTLGAVLFFTSVALLGAGAFVNVFMEKLPGGARLLKALSWSLPVFSFTLLSAILAVFYRAIPNTKVFWRAAAIGGAVVATLLMLNNFVAFLYVKRVFLERSLYGTLAIVPVLMLGLYTFWLCVLIGGIVSYAVQNVHFRNSQAAWTTLTESMRERLSLVVFLSICRRFRDCLPPTSASHLSTMLKVPTQLLNECLNRLVLVKLVTIVRPEPGTAASDYLYQPARPLNRLTLFDFKTLDDNLGEDLIGASLERIDPLLARYDTALSQLGGQDFFQKNLDQLLAENPFDESRPPFALGERQPPK
ncbi:MAG: YihY/virulence factor BrkB family protein [Verrucomicrobia bacterium]|nr:YihY/virulence factor BrkB family protein [Verrucomicrobiota bacterium]